jgi:hypothetical protein
MEEFRKVQVHPSHSQVSPNTLVAFWPPKRTIWFRLESKHMVARSLPLGPVDALRDQVVRSQTQVSRRYELSNPPN